MLKKKNNSVLITAGPVWVPIDSVRVITNIFGGRLGLAMARESLKRGYTTTLIMGPGRVDLSTIEKKARVIRFHFYDELKAILEKELNKKSYKIILHSAAVSDYRPFPFVKGKIKSGKSALTIHLKPTEKLTDMIRQKNLEAVLVKFKLEVNKSDKELKAIAFRSLLESHADWIVANDFNSVVQSHEAFIIDSLGKSIRVVGKERIAKKIFDQFKIERT